VPGAGLGLAIVRYIVLEAGGTFDLTVSRLGGLKATIRLDCPQ
jgi:C4-dicarboxylate-specific signal transduction histidine kinase